LRRVFAPSPEPLLIEEIRRLASRSTPPRVPPWSEDVRRLIKDYLRYNGHAKKASGFCANPYLGGAIYELGVWSYCVGEQFYQELF